MAACLANGNCSKFDAIPDGNATLYNEVDQLDRLIQDHLELSGDDKIWKLGRSPLGGRGVFTTVRLNPGDTVFIDTPIAIGPRGCAEGKAVCVHCLHSDLILKPCVRGCGLPLCSTSCQTHHSDSPECRLLRELGVVRTDSWNPNLYRSLTPLRCLTVQKRDREIIKRLQALPSDQLSTEVRLLKNGIQSNLCEEDEKWMDLCCRVMDGVAFQVITNDFETEQSSVRGIYPLAGLVNHSCSPNTRQLFSSDNRMKMTAVKHIAAGEEITLSYCPLLWATPVRNSFLSKTKYFICNCPRCQHPTEFGTFLSGLKCGCGGMIMPDTPRDPKSCWVCSKCERSLSFGQALVATSLLSSQPDKVKNNLSLSSNNHIVVDSIIRNIFQQRKRIQEMNEAELVEREIKIRQMLKLTDQLQLGECRTRGLLLNELYKTLKGKEGQNFIREFDDKEQLNEVKRILEGDVSIPKDILLSLTKY